ncbi:ATP-grasp domain-containing protein [Archaeoglobus sp.]
MKLFLFEFATCGERIDDSIAVEGLAMFKAACEGFKKYYKIHSFVRQEYSDLFDLPAGDLNLLEDYLSESDAFLIVAPEDESLLLELTKIGEKYAQNLGSSSKAISVVSDKWKLYRKLRGKVQIPETSKKPLDCMFIIKPRVSCAGEGISFGSCTVPEGYIAQEYVDGKNLSVSVIVGEDEVRVVSVNEQLLDGFKYAGAVLPARIEEKAAREVREEALKAVECIDGLNGYVGVDVVHSDQPYVIEINARLTTPVSAFERAYGISVADMLNGDEPRFARRQIIRKGIGFSDCFVKSGDYCLQISDF